MDPEADQNLVYAVFGGSDSELSEDEEPENRLPPSRLPDDDFESSGGSGEEYTQERRAPVKARGRKKKSRRTEEDDERRQAKKRKRGTKQYDEAQLDDMAPEEARKARLEMEIDRILKPKKAGKSKKARKDDEEVLDRFADEEVSRLRESMLAAAAEDDQSNREKSPATAKLKLLPQVMEVMRKVSLSQSIIDNNLLEGVRRWLEPLPDRSLPALNIQRDFFPVLKKMEFIDASVLKESGLGRIVLFYTKCKRVTADIQRIANDLVSIWSRPIIKRSASYRDKIVPVASQGDGTDARGAERLNAILARAKESEKGRIRKNAVSIPQRDLGSYTVAPNMTAGVMRGNISVDVDIQRRRNNAERMRMLTRKVTQKNQ